MTLEARLNHSLDIHIPEQFQCASKLKREQLCQRRNFRHFFLSMVLQVKVRLVMEAPLA